MNEKTLTAEQCSKLSLYILMTTKAREGEAATFSIGGWRTGCSPDKWSSTTSY